MELDLSCFIIIFALIGKCYGRIVFTAEPSNAIVPPNSPLQVPCTASTSLNGTLHILWKRNNTWIVDFDKKHYKQFANGSLFFQSFLYADQGLYQCSALVVDSSSTHLGQIYSQNATIKIAYIHDSFTLNPGTRSGLIGSNVQLQCLSPKSEPIAKVYWEKDSVRLTGYQNGALPLLSEKILSATILLRNLSYKDTGTYQCVAYNLLLPGKVVKSSGATIAIAARQERPYFEKRPTSVVVNRFQPFTWDCHIRGIPEPTVEWLRNGRKVLNDGKRMKLTSGSLHFVSVLDEHSGSYVCEGSNTIGKIASQPVAFVVAFTDYDFVKNPASAAVTHGDTLLLHCTPPRSYPVALNITWYKDYSHVVLGGTISVTPDNSLRVAKVTRSSEGVYFCQAFNPVTRDARTSRMATVTVRDLPRIQTVLANTSAVVGDTIRKVCIANGYPMPSLKWLRSNSVISNDGMLALSRVNLSDAGYYTCFATNSAGNDSKRFFLHVSSKPAANLVPSNKTRVIGQSVEFSCDFVGTPKPVTSWYFTAKGSSTPMLLKPGGRITRTALGIRIAAIVNSDEGKYACNGSSPGGTIEVPAFLTVHVPPSFLVRPRNQTAVTNSIIILQFSTDGYPWPTVTWFFNAKALVNGFKHQIASNSLTVRNTSSTDIGWYTCRISNVAGTESSNVYIDVQDTPIIKEFFVPRTVPIASGFKISCNGDGNPKPRFTWRRNSTFDLVIDNSRFSGNVTNIAISQARASDSGTYECILSNSVGTVNRVGSLIVQVLPYPPKDFTATAVLSTAVALSWSPGFDGFAAILSYDLEMMIQGTAKWQSIEQNISAHVLNYTVLHLKPFTVYQFRILSRNSIGRSTYSHVINTRTLEDAPSMPLNVHISKINATFATARWNSPSKPNGNITFYQIKYGFVGDVAAKYIIVAASVHEIAIVQLRAFSSYHVQIRAATNSSSVLNWGNYSNTLHFQTSDGVPSGSPSALNATSKTSTSITISFSAVHQRLLNGPLTGYTVAVRLEDGSVTRMIRTNETVITVGSLQKATRYSVSVKACNRVSCGPNSTAIFASTMEDVPGIVRNAAAVAVSAKSILVTWLEPSEKNGIITGYIVQIRNAVNSKVENITLPGTKMRLRKDGLQPNRTYFVSVAARTKIGTGPLIPEISVTLRATLPPPVTPSTTSQPTSTAAASKSQPTTATTVVPAQTGQSIDWLHEKNLPVLIGVSVAIFVLLILVIVLVSWAFSSRIKSGASKRERWPQTGAHSGADNPAYVHNRDVELEKRKVGPKTARQEENPDGVVVDENILQDDFLFEDDSEPSQIVDDFNPSNQYAFDDTIRLKGKDDSSPLVKLRNVEASLSDDASEYDEPYSKIEEVMVPIPEMFAFIDEEERKSEKTTPDEGSMVDPSENERRFDENQDAPKSNIIDQLASRKSPHPGDLTWDNYDTSEAVVHDPDQHHNDTPSTDDQLPSDASPSRKSKGQGDGSDKTYLIDNEETVI